VTSHFTLLEQECLLQIAGPDSATFLQGQTSCDTRLLNADTALPGVYCTPQGRVVCDFLLSQADEELLLMRMRRNVRAHAAATFGKYIIFSKAELSEQDDWQATACWGPDAGAALRQVFGDAPDGQNNSLVGEGYVLVQVDAKATQFECYLRGDQATARIAHLGEILLPSSESTWQSLQIVRGIGRIESATIEEFIPQMHNYELTGHISYKKGCYTGQEVVARLHYRGKSKRRMYLASLAADQAGMPQAGMPQAGTPQAGMPLFSAGTEQSVGNVVNAAADHAGTVYLLLTATAGGIEHGLYLEKADGPKLELQQLPYSLETD
jgi:folate-binding protein YgfZ